jgi:hypothetical protein
VRVNVAGPEVERINVRDAPGAKHEPAVGSQQAAARHDPEGVAQRFEALKQPPPGLCRTPTKAKPPWMAVRPVSNGRDSLQQQQQNQPQKQKQ